MPVKTYRSNRYVPTSSRSGDNAPTILRGANLFIRGKDENTYLECYGGSLDLNETLSGVAIAGTIAFTTTSYNIVGTGTAFLSQLHLGQKLQTLAGTYLVVKEVMTDLLFIAYEFPLVAESGVAAYRLPILFEVGSRRGSLLSGNILGTDRGNYIGNGSGVFYLNGQALSASLTATKRTQIAIYQPATNDYLIQTLGFDSVPVGITIANAAGATASQTFTAADVNTGTDSVTIAAHGYQTGQGVSMTNPGTFIVTAPQIAPNSTVYAIRVDANNIKFAETLADAVGNVPVNITGAGVGTTTVATVSKNMPAGDRSLRIAKASTKLGTPSYGNAGEKIPVTVTAGGRIQINFIAMDSNTNANDPHDAWRIYGTRFGGSTTTATAAAGSGPWYYIRTVTAAELGTTAASTYYLEYLDAEIDALARLLTFDNDAPPDAEFIGAIGEVLILVSCSGKDNTSPGVAIVSFKTGNLAAAPLVRDSGQRGEIPTSPPEIIIGFYIATGRLYLMTSNTLQIAVFTADQSFPIATRPFWASGFSNPYALCFANYQLFGFTNTPIRSPEEGTATDTDKDFAEDVKEIIYNWHPSRVFTRYDPLNDVVCYIYSACYKNENGWWVSWVVPVSPHSLGWTMPIIISSPDRDMIISGAATVNGHLEFLAGGRNGAGGIDVHTFRFDGGLNDGDTVPYYYAPQFSDDGVEDRPKTVKYPSVRAKLTNANFGIHGAAVGEEIDVTALEAGNAGSKTGAVALADSTDVTLYSRLPIAVRGLGQYTFEIAGEYTGNTLKPDGTPYRDRIDEVVLNVIARGGRH